MTSKLTVRMASPGVQSFAYYLDNRSNELLKSHETEGLSPWEFVQSRSKKSVNLSFGICLDHPHFKTLCLFDGVETQANIQLHGSESDNGIDPHCIQVCEEMVEHEPDDPSDNHAAVILEFARYKEGWIGCDLDVDDDFKFADLKLIWRSLDYGSPFLSEWTYCEGKTIDSEAEMEVVGLTYKNKEYLFGYDLSFGNADLELQYFFRDEDGNLMWDIFSNVFENI